nr:hypothetical protein [Tanacetum cinerariifolium]
AGGDSHPPKNLRKDHGTPSGTSVGGKSRSELQRLLAGAVLKAEVEVAAIPTLLFVIASVSTTPESEGGDHADSATEPNLRTIGADIIGFSGQPQCLIGLLLLLMIKLLLRKV